MSRAAPAVDVAGHGSGTLRWCANASRSDTTATAVASPPAPWPANTVVPLRSPCTRTTFSGPCARPSHESLGTSAALDAGRDAAGIPFEDRPAHADLPDHAADRRGCVDVARVDASD